VVITSQDSTGNTSIYCLEIANLTFLCLQQNEQIHIEISLEELETERDYYTAYTLVLLINK